MKQLWLIPVLPLAGFLLNGLVALVASSSRAEKESGADHPLAPLPYAQRLFHGVVGVGSVGLAAVLSFAALVPYVLSSLHAPEGLAPVVQKVYTWMVAGDYSVDVAFRLDALSALMLSFVTFVGTLIHVDGGGYMQKDEGYGRYFSSLNLFMFAMLMLVLADNLPLMFVGWEGVGLCSYLLIGYSYDKDFAVAAGKKAFIANRVGDFGMVLGIFGVFALFGTADVSFVELAKRQVLAGNAPLGVYAVCLLLFLGACGKSAQGPLYVWLPDAMAGPAALPRGVRQERAGTSLRVAAGRDGGPDAGLGAHPRRDDGHGGRLPRRPVQRSLRPLTRRADARGVDRGRHGDLRGDDRPRAERHQESARVLDRLAARLHVPRVRRRRVLGRHLPRLHARLLQGLPLSRFRLRHHVHASRAGHAADGWSRRADPADVPDDARHDARDRRYLSARRVLLERRRSRGNGGFGPPGPLRGWPAPRRPDGVSHVPSRLDDILRKGSRSRGARPRKPRDDDGPSLDPRGPLRRRRLRRRHRGPRRTGSDRAFPRSFRRAPGDPRDVARARDRSHASLPRRRRDGPRLGMALVRQSRRAGGGRLAAGARLLREDRCPRPPRRDHAERGRGHRSARPLAVSQDRHFPLEGLRRALHRRHRERLGVPRGAGGRPPALLHDRARPQLRAHVRAGHRRLDRLRVGEMRR